MSEPITRHQILKYGSNHPYVVFREGTDEDLDASEKLLNHWHEELEIAYILEGVSWHYIEGKCVKAEAGRVVVTNCGDVHNIIVDESKVRKGILRSIIILISKEFVEECFPRYYTYVFTNEEEKADQNLIELIIRLSNFEYSGEDDELDSLYVRGLILQILYYLCKQGMKKREQVYDVNYKKDIERLRGVLQYVENHYRERILQSEVAEKFYFSKEYFSHFFKRKTGITFMQYLTSYRLQKAKKELLETEKRILDIALDNGFCDGKSFIHAFKQKYGTTPLQYRKNVFDGMVK